MGLRLITPPASEPISLAEAKTHLRVIDSDQDSLISALITAARMNCENWTGRAFVDQEWELVLDGFPSTSLLTTGTTDVKYAIRIPKPRLIEVTQFAYDDAAGDEQIMNVSDYYVDSVSEPGWVVPNGTSSWPSTIDAINSVRIRFRAGYLSTDSPPVDDVPDDVKAAIKLTLGSLFEHRESQVVGTIASALPIGVEALLRPHRVLLGMA
jgi:uncharacterized phiE125 gp8 family phage protein